MMLPKRTPVRFEWVILILTSSAMILFLIGSSFAANLQARYAVFERRNRSEFNREMDPRKGDALDLPFKLGHPKNKLYFLGGCTSCSLDSLEFSMFRGDPTAILLLETTDAKFLDNYRRLHPELRFESYDEDVKRRFNVYYTPRLYIVSDDMKLEYVQDHLVPSKHYEDFIRNLR